MDMMDYLKQYGGEVKNRVMNPGQTLATALQQGMPTEQNPLGMFGAGALTKMHNLPNVFKSGRPKGGMGVWEYDVPKSDFPEGLKASKDKLVVPLPDGTKVYKLDDGSFTDTTGNITFKDLPELFNYIRNPNTLSSTIENLQYKDPFGDTTK